MESQSGEIGIMREVTMQGLWDFLADEGFRPSNPDNGQLVFKKEGKSYLVRWQEGRPKFVLLIAPRLHEVRSQEERQAVLAILNRLNADMYIAKLYLHGDHVFAVTESIHIRMAAFADVFPFLLEAVDCAVSEFLEAVQQEDSECEPEQICGNLH